jgi:molybdenum storage protein
MSNSDAFTIKDVPSALMRQTLLDPELVRVVDRQPIRLLPWLSVVLLGGRSICDRGGEVLLGLVDELRMAMREHRILVLTGSGIRGRHVVGVGLDLGLPTGVLAALAATEAEANGHMVAALLAADGVSYVPHGTTAHQLATHLAACPMTVSNGYPPFGLYEPPPPLGKLPRYGSDAGGLLLADAYGAARLIYVKDTEGICSADPGGDDGCAAAPAEVTTAEARELRTLPVDPAVLDLLDRARHVRQVRVINGLVSGNLTRALAGESVGTLLTAGARSRG